MERIFTIAEDFWYSLTCWLESKTEAFNAWAGAMLAFFLYVALLGMLIFKT